MATFFVILFLETNVGITFDIFSKVQKLYNDIFCAIVEQSVRNITPLILSFFLA